MDGRRTIFERTLYHTLNEVRLEAAGLIDRSVFARSVAGMVERTARDAAMLPDENTKWFRDGYAIVQQTGGLESKPCRRHRGLLLSRLESQDCKVVKYANLIVIARAHQDQYLHFADASWCAYLAYHGVLLSGDATWAYDDLDEMTAGGESHIGLTDGGLENWWV
ncbi:MAG TPA: hypothetical protein VLA97_10050 [Nocardioidaceae bacterium]|nr:hypothetical protein [Nocardioidaceae bacterium]